MERHAFLVALQVMALLVNGFTTTSHLTSRATAVLRANLQGNEMTELRDLIAELQARVEEIAVDVAAMRRARIDGMDAELSALRQGRILALEAELASLNQVPAKVNASQVSASAPHATIDNDKSSDSVCEDSSIKADRSATAPPVALETIASASTVISARTPSIPSAYERYSFNDDVLDELLEIGGDPTFLEQARDEPAPVRLSSLSSTTTVYEWDGIEDDAAHFDDD